MLSVWVPDDAFDQSLILTAPHARHESMNVAFVISHAFFMARFVPSYTLDALSQSSERLRGAQYPSIIILMELGNADLSRRMTETTRFWTSTDDIPHPLESNLSLPPTESHM
jgi:hypothetical protein